MEDIFKAFLPFMFISVFLFGYFSIIVYETRKAHKKKILEMQEREKWWESHKDYVKVICVEPFSISLENKKEFKIIRENEKFVLIEELPETKEFVLQNPNIKIAISKTTYIECFNYLKEIEVAN